MRQVFTRTKFYRDGQLVGTQLELQQTGEDLAGLARLKARAPLRASKPQNPCDIGLFSDDANQTDLIEMLIDSEPEE